MNATPFLAVLSLTVVDLVFLRCRMQPVVCPAMKHGVSTSTMRDNIKQLPIQDLALKRRRAVVNGRPDWRRMGQLAARARGQEEPLHFQPEESSRHSGKEPRRQRYDNLELVGRRVVAQVVTDRT